MADRLSLLENTNKKREELIKVTVESRKKLKFRFRRIDRYSDKYYVIEAGQSELESKARKIKTIPGSL